VELGTPNATFLVALDTGSDLFWVPCDCRQCATIPSANATGPDAPPLRPYSPRRSSTSEQVACDNPLCGRRNGCSAATNGSCPYEVQYVSANTSSSGVLVQDVLHLTRERPGPGAAGEALQAPVVFGCGQVQTGAFLDGGGGAVDGLMGLGMGKVSVPSALAASGLVASDSFSMCFGDDGVGRVNFGDAGSRGQAETPFTVRSLKYVTPPSVPRSIARFLSLACLLQPTVDGDERLIPLPCVCACAARRTTLASRPSASAASRWQRSSPPSWTPARPSRTSATRSTRSSPPK
jgi:hypothetical protein